MSSPTHPTPSDVDEECAFPSANILDYTSTLPNYFPATLGNISSDFLENSNNDEIPPLFSPFNICLGIDLEPGEWIKDSGCSKHIMGNRKLFSTYKVYNGGNVIFGSNLRGNIIGKGRGIRKKVLYLMKLGNKPKDKICLATIDENFTLWHRRLGHANMCLIQSLASKELVRNLPKLKFDRHLCDACKIGKQAHANHKA
ncbi:retrovirus-related pol polyprotein from transposon TNT 1-94 [Tanacetum coccineum]